MSARRAEGSRIEGFAGFSVLIGFTALLEFLVMRWMGVGGLGTPIRLWLGGFSLEVDPFVHLIPLSVFIVQIFSWLHIRKELRRLPRRIGVPKGGRRKKRDVKAQVSRRFDLRAAAMLVFSALSIFMFLSYTLYFRELFLYTGRLYRESTLFSWYIHAVSGVIRAVRGTPLKFVVGSLNSFAVKLYYALLPYSKQICKLDPAIKYVLIQYFIGLIPALVSLSYTRRLVVRRVS